MKIYNTLTRTKEELIPMEEGKFKIYACGPTVYNFIHVGNARPICVFDTLRKYLEFSGNEVTFVQNFTDIDDKIINKANDEGVNFEKITEKYIAEYFTDSKGLQVKEATIHPKATETVKEIIEFISNIVDKGFGYVTDNGDVYFRTKAFKDYGKLSKQPLDALESGARIEVDTIKEDPLDFALWKSAKPGEPFWESPFSNGRPGWHIECTAMIKKHLGDTIDIHCGGQDLVFPHHENEVAQGECCSDNQYANYWMHNGYITIDNKKMSKSLNNFFTVRDVANEYGYEAIRFLLVSSHYRSPINYSIDSIKQAVSAIERMYNCREALLNAIDLAGTDGTDELIKISKDTTINFQKSMDDDLNTADALASIFDFIKYTNIVLSDRSIKSKSALIFALDTLDQLCYVLGLLQNIKTNDINAEIEKIIAERETARTDKNYARSDEIRDILKDMGVTLKDTPQGVTYTVA